MTPDYSLHNVRERAEEAKLKHQDYIAGLMQKYAERTLWRKSKNVPVIGFCGHGRAGKDTAAEFLCGHTLAVYPGSASSMVLPVVATALGVSPEQAWNERHQHRQFWIEFCHAFRGRDYSLLIRMCLGAGDVAVGVRGRLELEHAVAEGVLGTTLWIDNNRVQPDPTVEYGPEDCDFVVPNHGSRMELYARMRKFIKILQAGGFNQ